MGTVIGAPGEAMEELDSPYHHCCAVVPVEPTGCSVTANYRHEDVVQGREMGQFSPESGRAALLSGLNCPISLGRHRHVDIWL
ncbi:hypothetical protein THAOC_35431 [Thalassiosira oceanica]|uniref:Uncharacterized protein n=1 Tax=Thalassiosira oceanica TaxID=159749 RepID=K0R3D7_THAOC|nr:hypothetical protein THAOC_35431 [Thalassiosira oceanica]|eukprot:EJK45929.1 hypothetical protein THAOC_35431 [Thalassiosira oceanica]